MVNNAITVRNEPGVPDIQRSFYAIEGMENLGQEDFILPRRSIMQATQQREDTDEHLGQFWDNLTETTMPSIEAVILEVKHAANKKTGNDEDKGVDCRSRDGITGNKYGACKQCQFNPEVNSSLWKLPSEEAKSLRCNRGYDLLCWDIAVQEMFFLGVNGSSVPPFRLFISKLARQMRGQGAFFSKVLDFTTRRVVEPGKKYYVLVTSINREAAPDEVKTFRDIRSSMAGVNVVDIDDAVDSDESGTGYKGTGANSTPPPASSYYDPNDPGPGYEPPEAYAQGRGNPELF